MPGCLNMSISIHQLIRNSPLAVRRTAAVAGALIVAAASLAPADDLPHTGFWAIPHLDKLAHILLYAMLAVLMGLSYPLSDGLRPARLTAIVIACIGYGALLECAQVSIPSLGRCFSTADILANALGAIVGALIGRQWLGIPSSATCTLRTSHC